MSVHGVSTVTVTRSVTDSMGWRLTWKAAATGLVAVRRRLSLEGADAPPRRTSPGRLAARRPTRDAVYQRHRPRHAHRVLPAPAGPTPVPRRGCASRCDHQMKPSSCHEV